MTSQPSEEPLPDSRTELVVAPELLPKPPHDWERTKNIIFSLIGGALLLVGGTGRPAPF